MNVKTEIIAVGSELLLGQIVNSNAQFLSKQLAELGMNVYYHTVVGDNPERLEQAIKTAQTRSNVLIFTGGLGPTKDDLTKETIAKALGKRLVTNEEALTFIEDYFKKTKRSMSENNKKQALVLENSCILRNDFGMAPGMALQYEDKFYMLLPGPPSEMKPMFTNHGRDYFTTKLGFQEKIISRVLRFFGIGESQLETDLQDLIDGQSNPSIAPLASDGEVTIRLTAKHEQETVAIQLLNGLEKTIQTRVGQYFYGYDETTLVTELMKKMLDNKLTLSAAESLTGGLFSEQLTSIKGTSLVLKGSIVCYTNEIKQNILKVSKETLKDHGPVSEQCAREMADNIRNLTGSDIGISFTGVAGPEPLENTPVGTVFIGISMREKPTKVFPLNLAGDRNGIRKRTAKYGYHYIMKVIEGEGEYS